MKIAIADKKADITDKNIPKGVSPSSPTPIKKLGLVIKHTEKKQIKNEKKSNLVNFPLRKITESIETNIGEVLNIVKDEEILICLKDSKSKKLQREPKKHLINKNRSFLIGFLNSLR